MAEGYFLGHACTVQGRQHSHLNHQLEAVTNPQNQFASGYETLKLANQWLFGTGDGGMGQAVGLGLRAAEVITIEKTAGQIQKVEVIKGNRSEQQLQLMKQSDIRNHWWKELWL
jgi:hypothetical protein